MDEWGHCLIYHTNVETNVLLAKFLSDVELEKIKRLRDASSQAESIVSRLLIKSLVKRFYFVQCIDDRELEIINQNEGRTKGAPELYFRGEKLALEITITHSCGVVGVWIDRNPIGMDIEKIFLKKETSFIEEAFTRAEVDYLLDMKSARSFEENLTILWCIKEALIKLLKCAVSVNVQSIQVLMTEDETVTIYFHSQLNVYLHVFKNKNIHLNVRVAKGFCCCKIILLDKEKVLVE